VAHVLTPTNKSHAIGVCIRHEHVSYYAHIQTPWDFFGVGSHTCNPTLQLHANDWGYRIYRTHAPIPWLPCVCSQCELLLFLISFVVSFLKIRVCCVPESQCIEILTHNEHGRFNGPADHSLPLISCPLRSLRRASSSVPGAIFQAYRRPSRLQRRGPHRLRLS
jgi:hypothetical protein